MHSTIGRRLPLLPAATLLLVAVTAPAQDREPAQPAPRPVPHLARFGEGEGPSVEGDVLHLLDTAGTLRQSNAAAYDRAQAGAFERTSIACEVRVLEGGDGGSFLLLDTASHGVNGPAPFLASWVEPNLPGCFAVAIDVHDPPNEEPFGPRGNYRGMPQREVSLHFDGREIVKRVAPAEFRGDWAPLSLVLEHVVGGAEITVKLAGAAVYERFFVAGLLPYEGRLAVGAGTREEVATEFDVRGLEFRREGKAAPGRAPVRFTVFDHVLTDAKHTSYDTEVTLPPAGWAFGRVILDLRIHDAGDAWDEWDRNGEFSVMGPDGEWRGIVPFITSYRTPCHWKVDVTHFRPWLEGATRLRIAAGTAFYKNRGFRMSATLEFHHGTPALEPYRVETLWHGQARHGEEEPRFGDFFTPVSVTPDESTVAARAFLSFTGHSQVGEFTPSRRTFTVDPDVESGDDEALRFESLLWKDDVYLNPNRPQFGTWKYSRAGWAPGDVVAPWIIDLGNALRAGRAATVRYEPGPYEFPEGEEQPTPKQVAQAQQVVRAFLVLYREPKDLVAAPRLAVLGVQKDSAAAAAGILEGDWLAVYDGRTLDSIEDLRTASTAAAASGRETCPVVLYRGAERLEVSIKPGRMGVQLAER